MRRSGPTFTMVAGLALIVANLWLSIRARSIPSFSWTWAVPFLVAGLVIWIRRPGNPVGPLLAVQGLFALAAGVGFVYGAYAWIPPRLEPSVWPIVLTNLAQAPAIYLLVIALLRFPDGRLPNTRWAPVEWLQYGAMGLMSAVGLLAAPGHGLSHPWASQQLADAMADALPVTFVGIPVALVLALVAMINRYRRAEPTVRAQLRWVLFTIAAYAVFQFFGQMGALLAGEINWSEWGTLLDGAIASLIPVSIGVAVLRYRLYEIDRIISRTVTYAVVAIVIGLLYALPVIVLPSVLGSGNDLIVAGATLAAAAAFNPVRRRIQTLVDRRFNRARFDSEQVLGHLSDQIRNQTALDGLQSEVRIALDRTISPAAASIWIREAR